MTPAPTPSINVAPALTKAEALDRHLSDIGQRVARAALNVHSLAHMHHPAPSLALALILLAICGVVLTVPGVWCFKRRHHLRSSMRGLLSPTVWKERHKWNRSVGRAEINGCPAPKPIGGWPTRSGVTLVIRFDGGMNLALIEKKRAEVASEMRCRDVQFEPIAHNQGRGYVRIIRRDALARSFPWPWMDDTQQQDVRKVLQILCPVMGRRKAAQALAVGTRDFLSGFPVGVDMDGNQIMMDLRERNLLVGGIMGSGKSWFLHVIIAAAALDPRVRLHILDGKMGIELACWEPICTSFATDDEPGLAYKIIARLAAQTDGIFKTFGAAKDRKPDWSKVKAVDLLIVDEFTAFLSIPGFQKALNELLRRGRAAGLMIICATQRPSAEVMKTDFRELFLSRAALLSDKAGSKMIMGESFGEYDSSLFVNAGEMWLLGAVGQGRHPIRCRGHSLTDRDLANLAARATSLRSSSPVRTVETAPFQPGNGPDTPNGSRSSSDPSSKNGSPLVLLPFPPVGPPTVAQPLSEPLRAALSVIAHRGPDLPTPALAAALKISPGAANWRCEQLRERALVTRTRPLRKPGKGEGAREPWLWTITDLGKAELTDAPERSRA